MVLVCIRQPGYLPYTGFFKKIQSSDIFVLLDDVQFEKNDWDNRNKIRTSEGDMWLTVPVIHKFGEKLNEIKISKNQDWNKKHLKAIQINYQKASFFEKYWNEIKDIIDQDWEKLIDLNLALIQYFNSKLKITNKMIRSSDLKINDQGSEKLLKICKTLNADIYLSGELGKKYLNEDIFHDSGIKIMYEKFIHPEYSQVYKPFIPNLSVMDLLFNEGDNASEIIQKSQNL